jgi:hypothetical protein
MGFKIIGASFFFGRNAGQKQRLPYVPGCPFAEADDRFHEVKLGCRMMLIRLWGRRFFTQSGSGTARDWRAEICEFQATQRRPCQSMSIAVASKRGPKRANETILQVSRRTSRAMDDVATRRVLPVEMPAYPRGTRLPAPRQNQGLWH